MKYEIFKGSNGEWHWHLKAANHEKIATSGEGYKNKNLKPECSPAISQVYLSNALIGCFKV